VVEKQTWTKVRVSGGACLFPLSQPYPPAALENDVSILDAIKLRLPDKAAWTTWVTIFSDEDIDTVGDLRGLTEDAFAELPLKALLRSVMKKLRAPTGVHSHV
jgi:hypothetical protein